MANIYMQNSHNFQQSHKYNDCYDQSHINPNYKDFIQEFTYAEPSYEGMHDTNI